jgi:aldose 1-epimerase
MKTTIASIIFFAVIFFACNSSENVKKLNIQPADFVQDVNGKTTGLYVLTNDKGMVVALTNYGARIVSILVPDQQGKFDDIALGYPNIGNYLVGNAGMGAVIGPYANRIANASYQIDGEVYHFPVNNQKACIHSGPESFYRQVFDVSKFETAEGQVVEMTIESPDGEWGFPGNKKLKVTYTLTDDNSLRIDYHATTDKACHFNLTNHVYFNLKGEGNGDILDHQVVIDAHYITDIADAQMIPTGKLFDIRGTALDFNTPHSIGERIGDQLPQLVYGNGYDHNYLLNKDQNKNELTFAGSIYEPVSGRYLECFTTEPAVQLYSANFLNSDIKGKRGVAYTPHSGVCLETQHYPDTPNHPEFPGTLLRPGEELQSTTIYKFSVKK